jgi:MFS family permease
MGRLLIDITPLRQVPDFRRLWVGQMLSGLGTQFTVTTVGLDAYALSHSTLAVGAVGAWALVPTVVLGLYGGALADRFDRRKVALAASAVMWVAVAGLALQAYLHVANINLLYALVALQAGASAVNSPARGAIVPRLVPPHLLAAANALSSMAMTAMLMLGPMGAALVVAQFGFGAAYSVDVVTFVAALYALLRLPAIPPEQGDDAAKRATGWRSVAQGLGFLATRPNLRMSFLTDFCAMILALPRVVFPAAGAVMIGGGATTVGLLTTFMAVGACLASVLSGPLMRVNHQGRAVVVAVGLWGVGVAGFGGVLLAVGHGERSQPVWWALALAGLALGLAGASDTVSMIFRGTILQSATPDALRGRLQGVFIVVVTGGPRLGDLVAGVDSRLMGEGWAVVVGGVACAAAVAVLAFTGRSFWRYDARRPLP